MYWKGNTHDLKPDAVSAIHMSTVGALDGMVAVVDSVEGIADGANEGSIDGKSDGKSDGDSVLIQSSVQ